MLSTLSSPPPRVKPGCYRTSAARTALLGICLSAVEPFKCCMDGRAMLIPVHSTPPYVQAASSGQGAAVLHLVIAKPHEMGMGASAKPLLPTPL